MDLENLFRRQIELQSLFDFDVSEQQAVVALAAEWGEFLNAVKGKWAWWKRHGSGFTQEEYNTIVDEAADVLHFWLLRRLAMTGLEQSLDNTTDMLAVLYAQDDIEDADLVDILSKCKAKTFEDAVRRFVESDMLSLCEMLNAFRLAGLDVEDVHGRYYAKALVNIHRWTEPR